MAGKLHLALIAGGASSERQVSLDSGEQAYRMLNTDRYHIHRYDPLTDLSRLAADAGEIDAALIILHGVKGEDGTIQGMLDLLDIPYQGSGVLGSALAMNKAAAKYAYIQAGIPTPAYLVLRKSDTLDFAHYINHLGLPLVVKPASGGSSIGMSMVRTKEALPAAIEKAFEQDDTLLLEELITGMEVTCGVMGNERLTSLPVVEIIPGEAYDFFDYEAKYKKGGAQEICPARISPKLRDQVQRLSQKAHTALYCRGYSRTDMFLRGEEVFVIETNTIPGMTPTSLLPLSAQAAGISFETLLDTLIQLSLEDFIKRNPKGAEARRSRILEAIPALGTPGTIEG